MSKAFVLVVDDEPEFLDTVSQRLTLRDFRVDTALDGEQALEKIQNNLYDVIVMDLQMPRLNGIDTLQQALTRKPNLQIILLTGHATVQKGVEAMRLGAMDFLEKPVDIEVLTEKIVQGRERRIEKEDQAAEQAVLEALKKYGL